MKIIKKKNEKIFGKLKKISLFAKRFENYLKGSR